MDTRRHVPVGRRRVHFVQQTTAHGRRNLHLGRTRRTPHDIFSSDHADARQGGRFRWMLSTCLAGGVGVLAILVLISGSMGPQEGGGGLMDHVRRGGDSLTSFRLPSLHVDGLRWASPKTDKLLIPAGATSSTYIVYDSVRQRRANREYIYNKPYARVVARLAPLSGAQAQTVPRLNPMDLYASTTPLDAEPADHRQQDATVKLVDLLGGIPVEDGQELKAEEVAELVARYQAAYKDPEGIRTSIAPDGSTLTPGELLAERSSRTTTESPNTSFLQKSVFETEETGEDGGGRELKLRAQRGETLTQLVMRLGAEPWQARAIIDSARAIFPDNALAPNQDVTAKLTPSVTRANRMEPVRITIFDGTEHKLTVRRNAAGEYVASASPVQEKNDHDAIPDNSQNQASSLYASLDYTAAQQGIPQDEIMQILRIHAYETDFRAPVRAGDGFEFFFDLKEGDKGSEGTLGDLLATSITGSGETHRFYRFHTPDGVTDFYDETGSTSRKFLMRRPVRGDDVRITSGFGLRRHPILQVSRMHYGVDWAAAPGTPIMAAGSGVIEEVGRKGEYGNYIRIRHANGYKTAYGHMLRFAPGMAEGIRVRQGQIIGYVGQTGMASGPHVHFEVLINGGHVDPMTIQVPRERQLEGKQLADFQRERARLDDLMRRSPTVARLTASAAK
jgi:murein DD-endopeptidase MepM/ murein hydrolase activator NlpD